MDWLAQCQDNVTESDIGYLVPVAWFPSGAALESVHCRKSISILISPQMLHGHKIVTTKQVGVCVCVVAEAAMSVVEVPGQDHATHFRKQTTGVLDMGGGSLQVAYEVPHSVSFVAATL